MVDSGLNPPPQNPPSKLPIHYIKSNHYRVIHVDGAHGGVTLRGLIEVNLYSERATIPQTTALQVHPDGRIGEEIKSEIVSRSGLIREVEVGAVMDLATARALLVWLQDKIDALESMLPTESQTKAAE
jgi:hypothetical protein